MVLAFGVIVISFFVEFIGLLDFRLNFLGYLLDAYCMHEDSLLALSGMKTDSYFTTPSVHIAGHVFKI